MTQPYRGKHKYREIAEFVVSAMAVWDRQHGQASRNWNELTLGEQASAIARVQLFQEGKLTEVENEREHMERTLMILLLPLPEPEENERTVGEVEFHGEGVVGKSEEFTPEKPKIIK